MDIGNYLHTNIFNVEQNNKISKRRYSNHKINMS